MGDVEIEGLEVRINPAQPKTDICDMHARANLFGRGRAAYPKARAPRPPYHPACWCRLTGRRWRRTMRARCRGARPPTCARSTRQRRRASWGRRSARSGCSTERRYAASWTQARTRLIGWRVGAGAAGHALVPENGAMNSSESGQRIVSGLIAAAQVAPPAPAERLRALWSNPVLLDKHVFKRVAANDVAGIEDYAIKTFNVLAFADRVTLVEPLDPAMLTTGKVQVASDGWVVLLSGEGRIVTSYPFDPSKVSFEDRHRNIGDKLHEHDINQTNRRLLAQLFGLR